MSIRSVPIILIAPRPRDFAGYREAGDLNNSNNSNNSVTDKCLELNRRLLLLIVMMGKKKETLERKRRVQIVSSQI